MMATATEERNRLEAYSHWLKKLDRLVLKTLPEMLDEYPPTEEQERALRLYLRLMLGVAANTMKRTLQ